MMSLKKKIAVLGVLTVLLIGGTIKSISASNNSYAGTSADPVVTKSYVDEAISSLLTALSPSENQTPSNMEPEVAFVPVKAEMGEMLVGGEGAEIILRSGKAVSYCSGNDGIIDVSAGTEYFNGTSITANHLLIVPRDDGRGAIVTSDEAWFIVKGGYEIR
ncbi:MAG: hypothetical protein HFE62_00250 [Firmicutes bacterium]|nr:hypothetical protein [Bacillota bacterium]